MRTVLALALVATLAWLAAACSSRVAVRVDCEGRMVSINAVPAGAAAKDAHR